MWELFERCLLLAVLVNGILILGGYLTVALQVAWLNNALILWNLFVSTSIMDFELHWRSFGLYLINITSSILLIAAITGSSSLSADSTSIEVLAFLQIIISCLTIPIFYLLPVPSPSPLLGHHKLVATTSFLLDLDPGYKDRHENQHQTFDRYNTHVTVQCWFPLQPSKNGLMQVYEKYLAPRVVRWTSGSPSCQIEESRILQNNIVKHHSIPVFILRHLALARIHSLWQNNLDRLIEGDLQLPIAIFSHGMYGWRQLHTSLCEDLASLGFMVFACEHAPDAMVTRPINDLKNCIPFDFAPPKNCDKHEERSFYTGGVYRRIRDIRSLIDALQDGVMVNRFPTLDKRLNLQHICLWGNSSGAGCAAAVCCIDRRITRLAVMDGWLYPTPDELRREGILNASILSVSSEHWEFGRQQVLFRRELFNRHSEASPKFDIFFKESDHQNYCEVYLLAAPFIIRMLNMISKTLNPYSTMDTLNHMVAAYFLVSKEGSLSKSNNIDVQSVSGDYGTVTASPMIQAQERSSSDEDRQQLIEEDAIRSFQRFCSNDGRQSVTGQIVSFTADDQQLMHEKMMHESKVPEFSDPYVYSQFPLAKDEV